MLWNGVNEGDDWRVDQGASDDDDDDDDDGSDWCCGMKLRKIMIEEVTTYTLVRLVIQ